MPQALDRELTMDMDDGPAATGDDKAGDEVRERHERPRAHAPRSRPPPPTINPHPTRWVTVEVHVTDRRFL